MVKCALNRVLSAFNRAKRALGGGLGLRLYLGKVNLRFRAYRPFSSEQRIKLVIGYLLRPLLYCLYFISGFFPRDPRIWAFGSWGGQRFVDNSAALFRYCCDLEGEPIKAAWISPQKSVRQKLRAQGSVAYHPWSLGGVSTCLKAGIYVFDLDRKDINYWLSRGAQCVLLRHGTGIKKIARAIDNPSHHLFRLFYGQWIDRCMMQFFLPWHTAELALVMATSEQHAQQAQMFFEVDRGKVVITGSPRNDIMFLHGPNEVTDNASTWVDKAHREGKRAFVYMPTFRDDKRPAYPYSWVELDKLAGRVRISVLVRMHPVDCARPSVEQIRQLKNVMVHDPNADPYTLFNKFDCLITDYSSVVYDFMLLRKPVIFFCHDLESFQRNSRGFCFDYKEVTPGPRARTLSELEAAIKMFVDTDMKIGPYRDAYEKVLNRFHVFQDGHSSERCYKAIVARLI